MSKFEQEKERFKRFLDQHSIWVMATGSQNDISARSISVIHQEFKFYFQTDMDFEKSRHIRENPHVALCCENYQVKGIAKILGPTASGANAELMGYYQKVHPEAYRRYSHRETSCLIEVNPESVQIWDYINGEPYITRMDLVKRAVETIKY